MRDDNKFHREKRYVEVDVRFTSDGKIRPLAINYDKSHIYGIDRVLAVRRGTSRRGGAVLHLHDLRAEAESLA